MQTKTQPKFQGKPIIEIPKVIPVANFLTGDFGKAVLDEYNGKAKADYQERRVLNVLSYQDGVVKGSNPFAVVLMNSVLGQEGIRTATAADLGAILRTGALDLGGQYEDIALVLRNIKDPNAYFAGDLQKQLKTRGEVQYPAMVNLSDLELVNDSESPYGLAFRLKDGAEVIHAEQLDNRNSEKRFSETDKRGLPIFDDNGSRTLYTRDSGLSGLGLDAGLRLNSSWVDLGCSGSDGRVVAIRDAVAGNDLEAEIESTYKAEIAELTSKRERALRAAREIMQGKA